MPAHPAPLAENSQHSWPVGARRIVTGLLVFHLAATLLAEFAAPPTSPLIEALASKFRHYYEFVDQGHAHRFYSNIGPTPILTAEIRFGDGRPPREVRVPDRSTRPRLVYQRHLALADRAFEEIAPILHDRSIPLHSSWGESYSRYLCRKYPGASGVILRVQQHRNPSPGQLLAAATVPGAPRIDPDADEFYDAPILLGDFPCPEQ